MLRDFLGHFSGSNPRPPASFLLLRTGKGMKLLDLFSGGKSVTRVAESLGYSVEPGGVAGAGVAV